MACEVNGMNIANYYSAEVDPYPVKASSHNFPDIVHLGSVTEVSYDPKMGMIGGSDTAHDMSRGFDLLMGGPPCQDLSIAGARAGLGGDRSGLFWEFVRLLFETQPRYFLMENVASMPKDAKEEITQALFGIEPRMIDSSLVSAQNRKRLYWVGKRNENGSYSRLEIPDPIDRKIRLRDVLEDIPFDDPRWRPLAPEYVGKVKEREKSLCITAAYRAAVPSDDARGRQTIVVANLHPSGKGMNGNVYHPDGLAPTLTTNKGEGNKILGIYQIPRGMNKGGIVCDGEKSPTVNASRFENNNFVVGRFRGTDLRVHADQERVQTLTSVMGTGGNNVPVIMGLAHRNRGRGKEPECNGMEKANSMTTVLSDSEVIAGDPVYLWRKLTVREAARCQTIPEWYDFSPLSDSRAYKGIGNGWTVDVIAHILSFMDLGNKEHS